MFESVFNKIVDIIFERKLMFHTRPDLNKELLTPKAILGDDLGFDSLGFTELIICLEDEFGIVISDNDAEKFTTIGDLCNYIANAHSVCSV